MGFDLHTYDYKPSGIPVLRISNLVDMYVNKNDNFIHISKAKHEELKNSQVQEGEVILSKAGKVGRLSILPKGFGEANLNQALSRIKLNKSIIPEYLIIYFQTKLGNLQFKRFGAGRAVQDDLKMSEIENLKLILPPQEIQAQIVAKMDNAYAAKKQKEAEAQQLLGSIDNYLLGELGIEIATTTTNTIENRMFTRRFSEVSGGRFDPFFNSLNKQDKLGKYPFVELKQLALIRKGNSITKDNIIEGNIPVIAGGQTSPYNHNVANNNGDIITVSASGYAGYVWYHENPVFASDCTMISSLNTNNISNKFLFEYLKSQQQDIYNLRSGAIQPHVYPSDLSRIKIPIPPLEKQMEIVHHIANLRNKAKELQQQAQDILEQTKQQVENMLLENK